MPRGPRQIGHASFERFASFIPKLLTAEDRIVFLLLRAVLDVYFIMLVQPLSQRRVIAHETGNAAHIHGYPRACPITAVPAPQECRVTELSAQQQKR